jgi:phosphoribosylformimino-5-aminoimidazole carboxamide ribotide isomerase
VTQFRPCIDLHQGVVKQIIGSSLSGDESGLVVNFSTEKSAADYAELYQKDQLHGGHVIMLGEGNEAAAISALQAFPRGLQVGGGITAQNACFWLQKGASHVIVTSMLFDEHGHFRKEAIEKLVHACGKERIVIDLSCKKIGANWRVMMNRWQKETDLWITQEQLDVLSNYCDEFLIHATDTEGTCQGMDEALIQFLGKYSSIKTTYAGGVNSISDLDRVRALSGGRVDLSIGSALDLFGSTLVKYKDCVSWNNRNA